MRLAVVGTGNMGSAIATAFASRTRHTVSVRGASPASKSAARLLGKWGITYASDRDLLKADAIFLAVPWGALKTSARALKGYSGILISVIVPWSEEEGDTRKSVTSAAERLAGLLPGVRVVNAFTSISSALVRTPGAGDKPTVLVCSDNARARVKVMTLVRECGFDPVNAGTLQSSRYTEDLGLLWVQLAYGARYGERVAFRVYVAPR